MDTNVQQATVTTSAGTYSIINIPPGNYSLEVTKSHFATARLTHVVLGVNEAASLSFKLTTGAVTQSITVSAEASTFESSAAGLGTVIGTHQVNDLPLNGRNFTGIMRKTPALMPGMDSTATSFSA
jgi:Carboxypeptidase regulatory-like domain